MENLFVFCLLLTTVSNWSEAAPANQDPNGTHDIRWRMVSGLETAYEYTNKLLQTCEEPLLNVTGDLSTILYSMCQLMEIQALAAKVNNASDLNAVLEQNVLDTCKWLNYLVNASEITPSMRFLQLSDTCEVGDTPRLSQYCLEQRLTIFYTSLYQPASDFYADIVVNQDMLMWLGTTGIPLDETNRIQDQITHPVSCTE